MKKQIFDPNKNWKHSVSKWENSCVNAKKINPIKELSDAYVKIISITKGAAKNLKWKSLKWVIKKDDNHEIKKGFLKHPFKYGLSYIRSIIKEKSYLEDGDFFLYGVDSVDEFKNLLTEKESIFVLGFSYCHKPFECPVGRFNDKCIHDPKNKVCQQCFIGKAHNFIPCENTVTLVIPTVHYIGIKMFELIRKYPDKKILFLITACEMTLKMFADFGNMVGIQGVGVSLKGRICNTLKAFELSETGIKPGLTVVADESKDKIFDILYHRHKKSKQL